MLTIIFMGPQGSGKGTQVALLEEHLVKNGEKVFIFETGKALREFMEHGSATASKVKASMGRGERQPVFLPAYLWAKDFIENLEGEENLFIDGSPRTILEAEVLDTALKFYKSEKPTVLFLNLNEQKVIERLLMRGRHDDTEEGIRERLRWYREEVCPAVEFYRSRADYTVIEIDGDNSIEDIHKDILKSLGI